MKSYDWGEIEYQQALDQQLELVTLVQSQSDQEGLVFCTHPEVVTLGRATPEDDVFGWSGPIFQVSRGGRATYHGPNQVIVYPILDLCRQGRRSGLKPKDLHDYLRRLELAIVRTLKAFNINAEARHGKTKDIKGRDLELTGVWVGEKKIASLGVAVKKWVTYHGLALNIFESQSAFSGINPCGFQPGVTTSIEGELASKPDRNKVINQLKDNLVDHLG